MYIAKKYPTNCDLIFEKVPFSAKVLGSDAYLQSLVISPFCTGSQWNLDTKFHWLPVQNGGMTSDWS